MAKIHLFIQNGHFVSIAVAVRPILLYFYYFYLNMFQIIYIVTAYVKPIRITNLAHIGIWVLETPS